MSAGARSRTGGLSLSMMALAGVALALLPGPALVTILAAFNAGNDLQFPPDGLSTCWITEFLRSDLFRKSFVFPFQLGAQVALISTILGTAAAMAMHRVRFRGQRRPDDPARERPDRPCGRGRAGAAFGDGARGGISRLDAAPCASARPGA